MRLIADVYRSKIIFCGRESNGISVRVYYVRVVQRALLVSEKYAPSRESPRFYGEAYTRPKSANTTRTIAANSRRRPPIGIAVRKRGNLFVMFSTRNRRRRVVINKTTTRRAIDSFSTARVRRVSQRRPLAERRRGAKPLDNYPVGVGD